MAARRLRVLFFGSSEFSLPTLVRLHAEHDVVAVVTQPPKPAGRGLGIAPTPVERLARDAGVAVLTPARLDGSFVDEVADMRFDLLASAAYGKIIPADVLALATRAALNLHPSLLPHYRGATPIQSALRDGCTRTGVTVFWMTARMDAGDIALATTVPIEPDDDYGTLHDKLAAIGGELFAQAAARVVEGTLTRTPQREEDATYCRPLTKDDARLQFDAPAQTVVNQVRALSPKPGGWMQYDGKRLKVLRAEVASWPADTGARAQAAVGTVIMDVRGPVVVCASGAVVLTRVIPEGKRAMSGAQFAQNK